VDQDFIQLLARIRVLTETDAQHKTSAEIFLSLIEEVGELGREIKIEDKHFGNAHKTPSTDTSIGEAVDVFIMSVALFYTRHAAKHGRQPELATSELLERAMAKLDKWAGSQFIPFKKEEANAKDVQEEGTAAVSGGIQRAIPRTVSAAAGLA
jgi:NTP pyrophosphatase (non-canonical NTP hydrolase)